jgi:hypothetical protein
LQYIFFAHFKPSQPFLHTGKSGRLLPAISTIYNTNKAPYSQSHISHNRLKILIFKGIHDPKTPHGNPLERQREIHTQTINPYLPLIARNIKTGKQRSPVHNVFLNFSFRLQTSPDAIYKNSVFLCHAKIYPKNDVFFSTNINTR